MAEQHFVCKVVKSHKTHDRLTTDDICLKTTNKKPVSDFKDSIESL